MTALSNPDPVRRVEAVRQVARTGSADDVGSLILRTNDPDPVVRGAIAQALGALDNRPAADALAALVGDGVEAVQLEAVAALARQKNVQAHQYLLLAYQRDGPAVRARVAELLKAAGGSPAEAVAAEADALYAKYSRELASSGAERLVAAERLGSSGRPEAIERLTTYLAAESRSLAMAAARGLGASGSPEARGPLEALLNEDDPALRFVGVEALGELGDPEAGPALLRVLQPSGLVAQAALRSLVHLAQLEGDRTPKSPERARPLLCEATLGSDAALTLQAAGAVKALGIGCPADKLRTRLSRGGDVAGPLAAVAVLWGTEGRAKAEAPDADLDLARLSAPIGSLLRNGSPQVRPLAARAAGALRLTALAGDLERARKEAGLEVQRSREHWIEEPLPIAAPPSPGRPNPTAGQGDLAVAASRRQPSLFSPEPAAALSLWAEATAAELRLSLPEAAGLMGMLVRDPSVVVRTAAAEAIPSLAPASQWEALEPLLEDPEPQVRAAALAQLAHLDPAVNAVGPWMIAELARAATETSVRPLVDALSRRPGLPGLDAALTAALERPETASAAAGALARMADPPAIAAILGQLRRPNALALPELLAAVASRSLSFTDAERSAAEDACRTLLFDPRPEVRAAAVRAVLGLDGASALADVQPLAGDYDLRVRRAVAQR